MLPDPVHVNQFTTGGARGRYLCTAAAGAMALDAYTQGRIRVGAKAIDDLQDDKDGGIGLDDVAVAWKRGWGLTFSHGRRSWTTVRARLAKGDGLVLQGSYAVVPTAYRAQKTFTGGHAIYVSRLVPGGVRVFDTIANGPTVWPEAVVRNFYLSGLANAGWGSGTAPGVTPPPPGGSGDPVVSPPPTNVTGKVVRIATGQTVSTGSCTQVTILAPGPLGDAQRVIPVPRESLADPCTVCPTGWSKAWYEPSPVEQIFGGWIALKDTGGQPNACVAPNVKVGDSGPASNLGGIVGEAGEVAGAAVAAAVAGLGPALTPLLYLAAVLALVLMGLYLLARS